MSRTIQIEVYSYEELSPEAQKAAREQWSDSERENGDEGACDWINDHFEYHVGEAGYPNKDIRWSLSYCQGDGMAFYGSADINGEMLGRLVKDGWKSPSEELDEAEVQRLVEIEELDLAVIITANSFGSHYAHYNTMDIEVEVCDAPEGMDESVLEAVRKSLESCIEEDVRNLSRKLADEGYKLIDDYHGDEHVEEFLVDGDYEFTRDGSMWSKYLEERVSNAS